jgi:hypothetical protein
MHASIFLDLLDGEFNYTDAGILDRTHLRLFTYKSAMRMILGAGYKVISASCTVSVDNDSLFADNKEITDALIKLLGKNADLLHAYQLVFDAVKEG